MRNSPRSGVELDRPPLHADRAAGDQVARGLEHQVPGVADRQEGELGAVGQVPEHHAPVRADGQHPAVMPDRRACIIDRLAGSMGKGPVFQGRIDLVRGQLVLERNDDPSVPAELRGRARRSSSAGAGPGPGPRAVAAPSQPLLASSVPAGWKAAAMPPLIWPSSVARRMPVAASQRSILRSLPAVARVRAVGTPGDSVRRSPARRSTGRAGRTPPRESGRWGDSTHRRMAAIWAPSGRKARSTRLPAARPPDEPTGRQVVDEELAILMGQGDPPAVRAESGRAPMNGARVVHGRRRAGRCPRPSGHEPGDAWSPGSGRRG